ncbi:hypothetical protein HIM_00193 [Hirsutella minnesotensis 3608]|nr:hypothetical protein HIM_00193 [Hirsutella minnesotensis 3608]
MEQYDEMDLVSFAFSGPTAFDEHKPIYIDAQKPSRALSAAQLRLLVRSLIAGLKAQNVEQGDCVLLQLENSVIYSALFFAIVGSGGVFLGCAAESPAHELTHLLQLAKPRLIITARGALSRVLEVCDGEGISSDRILVVDEQSVDGLIHHAHAPAAADSRAQELVESSARRLEYLLGFGESDWIRCTDDRQSRTTPAAMFLTSGTSGLPKAAIRSHRTVISHHRSVHYDVPYPVVRLMALPMYHSFGDFWTHLFPIRYGQPLYVLPLFEIATFLSAVAQHGITETYMVPAMVHILLRSIRPVAESLSSLRYIGISGAPIDGASMQRFQGVLAPEALAGNLWGMTEVGVVFQNRYGEELQIGSVGRRLSGYELRFVDPHTGDDVGGEPDCPGELWVRGPGVLLGYKGRADAQDDDGWFRTGDVVYARDGHHHIIGRTKDLIKVRGWSVAPAEIEGVILKDSRVKDVAVVGVTLPDGSSEVPRAYVVSGDTSSEQTAQEIASLVQRQLAGYKALDGGVVFVDDIPQTGIGKPHRAKLAQLDRQREKLASLLRVSVSSA